ncbi:MAG: FHA domain-containing protein [Anaerolineales bacterium]|nr:FHA domain-containing protein [Anaerolineales bacterium]
MKRIAAAYLAAMLIALNLVGSVRAQAPDSIWLTASNTAYKTGETVFVNLNASSATPIQGFTFQIRYDPSCLKPVNASSPIPGMNGLPLPQLSGLVDGSYASTAPQIVSGILAEIKFTALKGCQTGLTLESAALAIRNTDGFAAPLSTVMVGERNVVLSIDSEVGVAQPAQPESGSVLSLEPPAVVDQGIPTWWIYAAMLLVVIGLLLVGSIKLMRMGLAKKPKAKRSLGTRKAVVQIKHGPQAGKSFVLNKFPVLIGRDPQNDICVHGPNVIGKHAQIYAERNGYYLMDLGGETFINGRQIKGSAVVLYPGDVIRLGKSAAFVFG